MAKSTAKTPAKRRVVRTALARFTPRQFKRITTEMYQRNLELSQLNKTLSLLRTIDQIVLGDGETLQSITAKISSAIVDEYKSCAVAAVYSHLGAAGKRPLLLGNSQVPAADGGDAPHAEGFLSSISIGYAKLQAETATFFSMEQDRGRIAQLFGCNAEALAAFTQTFYIQGFYVGLLMASGGPVGILLVGLHEAGDESTQTLLARVTEVISKAVENKVLQDENQLILQKLRQTNAKLKALDATKDEFITMASHQLRTPLTAVKGYLSMVLEGDAGKLNPNQHKLLEQSYMSSQRMVYLIADLLNLSRLNTGKFVIELTPVDLAEVVQTEVDQLAETAKARGLQLVYARPAGFPRLMLDETKIHQVVMNLIDNAIYYTPTGGTVTVALAQTPTAVEYTVTDTGIGVPKAAQHKLFTKFYRAGNAQRARPDGTGLGLFMAKKVIVAQGGSIIFDSEEGKGSTFGFRFSKTGRLAE
ncbi:MAG TPA: HAMP domain-containing sensor histidine kinase [Candidatus Saccharimonadales bacterium]|nr:HAMP domain-containing sensor histidine kinase [Candidatus Saccharimonadales bacterium]